MERLHTGLGTQVRSREERGFGKDLPSITCFPDKKSKLHFSSDYRSPYKTIVGFEWPFSSRRRSQEAWVEGDLKINGRPVAHVVDEKNSGDAFRDLEAIAEEVKKQTPRPIAKKLRRQQPK